MPNFGQSLAENEQLVGVDSESTYGDDAFGGSDPSGYLAFNDFTVDPQYGEAADESVLAVHSGRPGDYWGDYLDISYELPLTLSDGVDTPPVWAPLLKAANFEETVNSTTDVTYKPVTGDDQSRVPSATAAYYMITSDHQNAYKWLLEGLRNNVTIQMEMNSYATISGDARALWATPPDTTVAKPSNPTEYSGGNDRPVVQGMSATADGNTVEIESLEISTEWSFGMDYEGANTPDGSVQQIHLIRNRGDNMSLGMTLKARGHALNTLIPGIEDSGSFSVSVSIGNGTRSLDITMPVVQITGTSYSGDSRKTYDLECQLCGDFASGGGENDLQLVFS